MRYCLLYTIECKRTSHRNDHAVQRTQTPVSPRRCGQRRKQMMGLGYTRAPAAAKNFVLGTAPAWHRTVSRPISNKHGVYNRIL